MLASTECYRLVAPVDIAPLVAALPTLQFVCAGNMAGDGPCFVTIPGAELPETVTRFVEGLGLGGETHRRFFRRLEPGQGIPRHVDSWIPTNSNIQRFQVPVVSHPSIVMRWPEDGVEIHLAPGFLYEVRYDRPHQVVNETTSERIHLQIDQIGATI